VDGSLPTPSTPEEYAASIKSELRKWGDVEKPARSKPGYGAPGLFARKILCNVPLEGARRNLIKVFLGALGGLGGLGG
jgi:hypothetical protein